MQIEMEYLIKIMVAKTILYLEAYQNANES